MPKNLVSKKMTPTDPFTKQFCRQTIFDRIKHLDWTQISVQICQQLKGFFKSYSSSKIIAGYSFHQYEANIFPFLSFWQHQGGVCYLPVIIEPNKPLVFKKWDIDKPLVKGKYSILIPDEAALEMIPDIVLVPLVGFDQHGNRLGRGGGYYDRTIAYLRRVKPDCQIIGIACEQQYCEALLVEDHDAKLDAVITETNIFHLI